MRKQDRGGTMPMKDLSIGIAHYNDFDGAYFTIQDIRKELLFNGRSDLLDRIEFVIIENNKTSDHAEQLKDFAVYNLSHTRSLNYNIFNTNGTAAVKNKIVELATGKFVLVLDCHVLLCPTVSTIEKIFDFIEKNPETDDLYNGPLVHDNMFGVSTHCKDEWRDGNWGVWSTAFRCDCEEFLFDVLTNDEEISTYCILTGDKVTSCPKCDRKLPESKEEFSSQLSKKELLPSCISLDEKPFEIFSQGTGCFLVRKESWLGYNEHALGFGGEECYIHEKYRKNGRKAYCLPFLKWLHRFRRVDDVEYPSEVEYKLRNYILEFIELELDLSPVYDHFVKENEFDEIVYNSFVREAKYLYNKE